METIKQARQHSANNVGNSETSEAKVRRRGQTIRHMKQFWDWGYNRQTKKDPQTDQRG